jgi:hypothetical protein
MNAQPQSVFDDLLGVEVPVHEPHRTTRTEHEVAALLARAVASLEPGAATAQRSTTCCRCESLADRARRAGDPVPPVHEADSWYREGRLYRSALCRPCQDVEWSERWQRLYDAAKKATSSTEMRRLTALVQDREKAGRRFYGVWKGESPV